MKKNFHFIFTLLSLTLITYLNAQNFYSRVDVTPPSCNGAADGSATVNVYSSSTAGPGSCFQVANETQTILGTAQTQTSVYCPWPGGSDGTRLYLYRASDLLAAGMKPGTIKEMAYLINPTQVNTAGQL